MGCYYHFCSCQEARPSSTEEEILRNLEKKRAGRTTKTIKKNMMVIASLTCTNIIGGTCARQTVLLNSICAIFSSTEDLSEKKDIWRISNLEIYLLMFNVILNYMRIFQKLLPTSRRSSGTLVSIEMTRVHLGKNMLRKKEF